MIAAALETLAGVIFPPVCVHCRGLVEDSPGFRHVCRFCAAAIHHVAPPLCPVCGHPYFGAAEGLRTCPHCAGLEPAYREARTAVLFKGAARSLLIELKYHEGVFVGPDIDGIWARSPEALEFVRGGTLVPVPLHPRKERERGFNQSALLARSLARAAGGGTGVQQVLRRLIDTRSQTAFGRHSRRENLKNAFALKRGVTLNPDRHYILVDDVFTTGSTLDSCARVLRRAGCLNLDVVTFGHG